jgi:hypothetical protein
MQGITLFRRLIEDLELCVSFKIDELEHQACIYLSYGEPVDLIIWLIDKEHFNKHLRKFFVMEKAKDRSGIE